MKLFTEVIPGKSAVSLGLDNGIVMLGSCFSDEIGRRMQDCGFNLCRNPFGTLYNPLSILGAVRLLCSDRLFGEADCVQMGAGSGLWCSFSHHSSFARRSPEEFLRDANAALVEARRRWNSADRLILTLGTAMVWKHGGEVVANCLKRAAGEFTRGMMSPEEVKEALNEIFTLAQGKQCIVTVSPIRHLGDGAHANTLSKAVLQIGTQMALQGSAHEYFPAYEILCDELRDYRFYAKDLVHPSETAADIVWERFQDFCVNEKEREQLRLNLKTTLRSRHIPLHGQD